MSDIEFLGKVIFNRVTSLEEDFKKSQDEFRRDELNRTLRRSGKIKENPLVITYERFPEES